MFIFCDYKSSQDSEDGKSRLVVGSLVGDGEMAKINSLEGVDADYIFSKLVGSKENLDKLKKVEDETEKEETSNE